MQPQPSTPAQFEQARAVLRQWAARQSLPVDCPDEELVMQTRAWAAHRGWQLSIGWRVDQHAYAGCWHYQDERCEDVYFAPDIGRVRLLACADLVRHLAASGGELSRTFKIGGA